MQKNQILAVKFDVGSSELATQIAAGWFSGSGREVKAEGSVVSFQLWNHRYYGGQEQSGASKVIQSFTKFVREFKPR